MFARKKLVQMAPQPPMQAISILRGALVAVTVPTPMPDKGEVLIKVAYAGVNRADLMQVAGDYPPPEGASPLPGMEVSGWIAQVGDGVKDWSIGQEVCALIAGGGYAEYVVAPATQVFSIPASLSLAEAATLPEATMTSAMALMDEGRLKAGERVLLHGGTSGVGLLMGQIARTWGAEVYATAGGAEKCAFLAKMGIHAINHSVAPFAETLRQVTNNEGVDVIIDILGGPQFGTHLKLLRKEGRLVMLAMMEGSEAESVRLGGVLMKHLRISGATLRSRTPAQKAALADAVRQHVWPHLGNGTIRPVVDQVFPLEQAEKAHARMQERLHIGKILLEVGAETPLPALPGPET